VKRLAIRFIRGYQSAVSPVLGNNCKFEPSCSDYSAQAIEHYGIIRGVPMTAWRIARCNPFSKGGYDPPVKAPPKASGPTHLSNPQADA
jgi:putative membrane protein insertion efficiency factor